MGGKRARCPELTKRPSGDQVPQGGVECPGGMTKSKDGDIKCPRGVTPNPHEEWHQEPQGCHYLPAVSTVSAAVSPVGVSSRCVTRVPGAGTVPCTGHLLLGPNATLLPPSCTRISFLHTDRHPARPPASPPCATVCASDSPGLSPGWRPPTTGAEATQHRGSSCLS